MITDHAHIGTDARAAAMLELQRINESLFPPRAFTLTSSPIFIGAMISVASVTLIGLFLYEANAQTSPQKLGESAVGGASSSALYATAVGETPTIKEAPMREVHIANNGLMLLRGATVISNSGGNIRVGMMWGSSDFTWTIKTKFGTTYLTSRGQKEGLQDIEAGDIVTVTGMLTESGTEPTIAADFVRE